VKPLLLTLAATVTLLAAAYFILIVISYAYAAVRPAPPAIDLHMRPPKALSCVACVSLMAPPERP